MTSLITSQVTVVACGDFNMNSLKDRSDYLFSLESLNLKNVISTATRVTDQSESIIDHMLCHAEWDVSAGVYDVSVTDLNPTFMFIPCKYLSKVGASRLQRSAYVDYVRLNRLLQDVDFENIYDNHIEKESANFLELISNLIRRSTRERTRRNYNHAICPWMTNDLLEMLKLKDSYYKWKNNRSNTYYRESFKFYRNKSVTMKRKLIIRTVLHGTGAMQRRCGK